MKRRCLALLSGGLDSMLAIRIMQEQGVEVEALNFKTLFTCCQDQAGQAARDLGVRLTVLTQDDDYLDLIRNPQFGYGKGANPCVDCRIYMFERARRLMLRMDAQFLVSGEVVGQRPMSQKRKDLNRIAVAAADDVLLRPLSAKLLEPTKPEREGLVDREKLYGFWGRSRKGLIELAKQLGLRDLPTPSNGCALTEKQFSQKVFDLIELAPQARRWDFELLKYGRHFRFDDTTKLIVGRSEMENEQLTYLHGLPDATTTAMLVPTNFAGPLVLIGGPATDAVIDYACGLMLRYAKSFDPERAFVDLVLRQERRRLHARRHSDAEAARTVASAAD